MPITLEEALAHNQATQGGSRAIEFEPGFITILPMKVLEDTIEQLRALPPERRQGVVASVLRSIARDLPVLKADTASAKQARRCAEDIGIWFANEVIEGRQGLEVH